MSINRPVNIGLIGAGRIGSFHAESVARRLVDANLVAIADPAPGAAEKLAAELGAPNAYTSVSELLANRDIDGVVIATPARFHTNIVVEAAEAGKAVFCEKPMALTLEDADRAIAAARAAQGAASGRFQPPLGSGLRRGARSDRCRKDREPSVDPVTDPRPRSV